MQMYAVLRHGARYPTAKRAAETERFKTLLLEKLGPEFPEFTASTRLRPATQFMHHGDISALGMKEQFCLAARLKQNFPYLLNEPYSMHHYQFRSSQTSRSFKRFAQRQTSSVIVESAIKLHLCLFSVLCRLLPVYSEERVLWMDTNQSMLTLSQWKKTHT